MVNEHGKQQQNSLPAFYSLLYNNVYRVNMHASFQRGPTQLPNHSEKLEKK